MKYEVRVGDHVTVVDAVSPEDAKAKASEYVRPMNSDDMARGLAQGVPGLGGAADEMNAVTNAFLSYLYNPINEALGREYARPEANEVYAPDKSFSERVSGGYEMEQARDKQLREAHPTAMTGLNIAGGVASMGGVMRALPELTMAMYGKPGAGFLSNVGRATGTNATIGGTDAFFRSDKDIAGRTVDAGKSALLSGAVSAAVPLAGRTAITGAQWATNVATSPQSRQMLKGIIDTMIANGGSLPATLTTEFRKLIDNPQARQALIDAATTPAEQGMLNQYIKSILGGETAVTSSKLITGG